LKVLQKEKERKTKAKAKANDVDEEAEVSKVYIQFSCIISVVFALTEPTNCCCNSKAKCDQQADNFGPRQMTLCLNF
jgi:hypothetical protein